MDTKEHFYNIDIPNHPDAQTNPKGFTYFFLGNGLIQAAVQHVTEGSSGTALGLLIMNPDKFGKKADALTFHPQFGLEKTALRVRVGEQEFSPSHGELRVRWEYPNEVPTVVSGWRAGPLRVQERFFCPTFQNPWLTRTVKIENRTMESTECELTAQLAPNPRLFGTRIPNSSAVLYEGVGFLGLVCSSHQNTLSDAKGDRIDIPLHIEPGDSLTLSLHYYLGTSEKLDSVMSALREGIENDSEREWKLMTQFRSDHTGLDHLFRVSKTGLKAAVSSHGKMDGSIWQYNREWLRDKAMVAVAQSLVGNSILARSILEDLLERFVSDHGDTVDSSEWRNPSEVELDQNGELLYALWMYWQWTGDDTLIKEYWTKIIAVADFPLQEVFWDKSSRLLRNCREYWERHAAYGIRDGYELSHQVFVTVGLEKAYELGMHLGEVELAKKWEGASKVLRNAMLTDPKFKMVEADHFIKRRLASGEVQRTLVPLDKSFLPKGVPLVEHVEAYLDPDSSEALPIVFNLIPPDSTLSKGTMGHLELLWNQEWKGGGYGRYHVSSEPDSPGPWPFATLFIAQAYLELGDSEKVWRALNWLLNEQGGESGSWFEFYGPRPVPPFPQVGVVPWTWAEIVVLFIHHLLGIRPHLDKLAIRPKLLTGLNEIRLLIRIRGQYIDLTVTRFSEMMKAVGNPHAIINGKEILDLVDGGLEIPFPHADCEIRIIQ